MSFLSGIVALRLSEEKSWLITSHPSLVTAFGVDASTWGRQSIVVP
jgi:hypothetical protein